MSLLKSTIDADLTKKTLKMQLLTEKVWHRLEVLRSKIMGDPTGLMLILLDIILLVVVRSTRE